MVAFEAAKEEKIDADFFFLFTRKIGKHFTWEKERNNKNNNNNNWYGYHFPLVASEDPIKDTKE